MDKRRFLPVALICALLAPASAGAVSAQLKDAITDYNEHHYGQAIEKLTKLEKSSPSDASVHYYMALSYQGAAQMAAAKQEYYWVYENSSDQRMKYNSWIALQRMDRWSLKRAYAGNGNNFHKVQAVNMHLGRTQPVIPTST